jgi:hypothetical protein
MSDKPLLDSNTCATYLLEDYEISTIDSAGVLAAVTRLMREEASRGIDNQILFEALRTAFKGHTVDALRDEVLMQVAGGEMRPSHAESLASAFGWEPFAAWADPASFDPMAEPTWTLPMAAAWIDVHECVFRDVDDQITLERIRADDFRSEERDDEYVALPEDDIRRAVSERNAELRADAVRRVMPAYVAASKRWARVYSDDDTDEELGFELAPRIYRGWLTSNGSSTVRDRLVSALAEGKVVAERFVRGAWTAIPAGDWRFLRVISHDGRRSGVIIVLDQDGCNIGDVRVSREAAMRLWPAACA